MADRERNLPVGCGYGLLGLCCDACLYGPCRISPFDAPDSRTPCGGDRDWITAHNLKERVLLESLQAMAAFRRALERGPGPDSRIEPKCMEGMRRLLTPSSRKPSPLLDALYPEAAFPSLHALGFPSGSWMAELQDAAALGPPAKGNPEAILTDAIRLAAMALAAKALAQQLSSPAPEEIDILLPDTPSPFLLLIGDEDGLPDEGRGALMEQIDAACGRVARVCRLPRVSLVPAVARRVYARWGIPVSMTGSIAVVCSSALMPGLGALAAGFSLLPLPGYPIQGSPLVERFFTRDLKRRLGHAYLAVPPREDPCEALVRSLAS